MEKNMLMEKWAPLLKHEDLPTIGNSNKEYVTAQILENTENFLAQSRGGYMVESSAPTTTTGNMATYDPVLISMVRRAVPNLIAHDIAGVQPMTGPTGLIFALRPKYLSNTANTAERTDAFYDEALTDFSGTGAHVGDVAAAGATTGTGMATAAAEMLGTDGGGAYREMSFDIDKISVTAKSRALKAEYSTELEQDMSNLYNLSAETELSNLLAAELLAEINRELIRTIFAVAKIGAQTGTATAGTFDLDVDANGRWSVEKFKGLMFQIEREANAIAKETRRGKGNLIVCSSDIASALQMAGMLDVAPALAAKNNLEVDDTGNTFVGVLNGRFRVYVDPYTTGNYLVVGYKGTDKADAGVFYCPYIPIQMVRARGEDSFQSKIGFKTRYGMVANPFANGKEEGNGALEANKNVYYRKSLVTNLM